MFQELLQWIANNEAALSGLAAALAIAGVLVAGTSSSRKPSVAVLPFLSLSENSAEPQ
jgi:hypothetical protein